MIEGREGRRRKGREEKGREKGKEEEGRDLPNKKLVTGLCRSGKHFLVSRLIFKV